MTLNLMIQRILLRTWKRMAGRVAGYLLGGAFTWLVKQKVITEGESQYLLLVAGAVLVDLGVTVALKLKKRFELQLALLAQPGDKTPADLTRDAKIIPLRARLLAALRNVEELPAFKAAQEGGTE